MTKKELKEKKADLGYSNDLIAKLSGVSIGTVQKIMSGVTKYPRKETLRAIEAVLDTRAYFEAAEQIQEKDLYYQRKFMLKDGSFVREAALTYGVDDSREYTLEDVFALPEGTRAELIDGKLYYMSSPKRIHQQILAELFRVVANYIYAHNGKCKPYFAPFGVKIFKENGETKDYFEPDLSVICDESKLDESGCIGMPDWVVEIVSVSSVTKDYVIKTAKYRAEGAKEYWIIDPIKERVTTYIFWEKEMVTFYGFEDQIPCTLYPDLKIRISDLL